VIRHQTPKKPDLYGQIGNLGFSFCMSATATPKTSHLGVRIVDLALCLAFFGLAASLIHSHVPSENPKMVVLWTVLAGTCMTTVFWLAIQMFRVVLCAQRARK
jgi:RsiW-degrading membrane proteinase PrsW (M82 family)